MTDLLPFRLLVFLAGVGNASALHFRIRDSLSVALPPHLAPTLASCSNYPSVSPSLLNPLSFVPNAAYRIRQL
ncbi:hypothetical protein J3R83DRAFT_5684 [Lanmaoa asiatica]|nr:hypothetical protein J3R83DRAFT_5684 [Lanmaoa asiatica]